MTKIIDYSDGAIYLAEHIAIETNEGYKLREATIAVFRRYLELAMARLETADIATVTTALYILDANKREDE